MALADKDLLSIQQARRLVERAHEAGQVFQKFSQDQVDRIVAAMAKAGEVHARHLAESAVAETGYGRVRDKTIKNLFCSVDVHEYIRGLKTCGVISENKRKKVITIGVPVGVIAAIIPTTNPTSTAIFKILCAVKGRNTIVLSPHPNAMRCTCETMRLLYEAGLKEGLPEGAVSCLDPVTMEGTTELMRHRSTALILATGGAGLVRAAYSSGKPAYGVGPGNVPAYIESSADVAKAVRDVIAGKTFDHGVLCSSEQALVCDRAVEEQVLDELVGNGAYLMSVEESEKVGRLIQSVGKGLNPSVVGKSPQVIAQMAGFSVPDGVTCLVGRPGGVGREHPLSMEKLSPILALYVVEGWEEGCERCIEILSFGGLGHTMAIHSRDERIILEFGLNKPAYRICVNTPATLGSVGLTTGVPPSMTLGCGTPGGNITSDNITPMHLINLKRLAYEIRPFQSDSYPNDSETEGKGRSGPESDASLPPRFNPTEVRRTVRDLVDEYLKTRAAVISALPEEAVGAATSSPPPPPPIPEEPARAQPLRGPAVDFVCEEDVRCALQRKEKIVINSRTILTPSARDLGEEKSLFVWSEEN